MVVAGLVALGGAWLGASEQQRGAPPPTTGTAFLAGQVVDATNNQPISGATVTLIAPQAGRGGLQAPIVVDSQGRFFFANLPAGSYRTQVIKTGYTAASLATFSRSLDLADGERVANVRISLLKLGGISGVVRDDGGDPMVGIDVIALERAVVNGRSTLRRYTQSKTDDRGSYRLAGIRPGEYYVCACAQDPMPFDGLLLTTLASDPLQLMGAAARALRAGSDAVTLDSTLRTIAPTFFPNSPTIGRATRVVVAAGEQKNGVDIDATTVRAGRVSGTIVGASNPVTAQSVRLIPTGESIEGASISQLAPVLVQPDGRFDFAGVPPGLYTLRVLHIVTAARGGGPSGSALALVGARAAAMNAANAGPNVTGEPILWATQSVTVGDDGVSGLVISLSRGTPLTGRVQFVGASPPPTVGRGSIAALPLSDQPLGFPAAVSPDFTFRVAGIVPGRYELFVSSWPGWPTVKSVVVGGVDVTDLPIDVADAEVSDVVVTMSDVPRASVSGSVAGISSASPDKCVVLFPTNRRYWVDPAASQSRFFLVPVNAKGQFKTAPAVPAGEYFYAVVTDEASADWPNPTKLETWSRSAPRVTVIDGQNVTLTVR